MYGNCSNRTCIYVRIFGLKFDISLFLFEKRRRVEILLLKNQLI